VVRPSPASLLVGLLLLGPACLAPLAARAQPLDSVLVASGLQDPLFVAAPALDGRLFIVERRGRIQILDNGAILPQPFLDIRSEVSTSGERGLLGLAFAQDYPVSGEFYVYYVNRDGNSVVSRFAVSADPNLADPTETVILVVDQPFSNHNGGTIAFDADGFLLFGLGDGGDSNDPAERAQDPAELLGKMLRIDVGSPPAPGSIPVPGENYAIPADNPWAAAGDGVRDEIWAFGLRNPYRFSVDRLTGDLWIADVGQNQQEEIDFEPAGDPGGRNWGWDVMEGTLCNLNDPAPAPPCNHPSLSLPIHSYSHSQGRCSITGGYAYRGVDIPGIQGHYFYGDYCTGEIWSLEVGVGITDRTAELGDAGDGAFDLVGFGEDSLGRLYVVHDGGDVYRITKRAACQDALDNDGDGEIDHPDDPGCASPTSNNESPACNDGQDNDGDGLIDLADPQCNGNASRNRESAGSGCGNGLSALLVPAVIGASRLRRRRRS
jgi:hypothetical protein